MGLEVATYVDELVTTNPVGATDTKSQGDDHLRLIKTVLKSTFPGLVGRVSRTVVKTANYTAVLSDNTTVIEATGTWTLSLTAAATLGNGWTAVLMNRGTGTLTVDPDVAELVNGSTTLTVPPGYVAVLFCTGTAFLLYYAWDSVSPVVAGSPDFTGGLKANGAAGKAGQALVVSADAADVAWWAPKEYLFGLTLANNGVDALNDVDIASGEATDDTGAYVMKLTSGITKRLDTTWVVGTNQGGLDAGVEAVNTWYRVFLIMRPDTGVVDVLLSASDSPTMPTNYTVKRRIGYVRNDASSNILAFTQFVDEFVLNTPINDVSEVINNTATLVTLTVPPATVALFRATVQMDGDTIGDSCATVFYGAGHGAVTPDLTTGMASLATITFDVSQFSYAAGHFSVRTDSSSRITHDSAFSVGVTGTIDISTYGWLDTRGVLV